ncbi:MAG TPA: FtsX-like permease family protein [Acidimicrobiales bacterium]|nr:FtsX-like permease family protein [Acidimicrobiales bacterium]
MSAIGAGLGLLVTAAIFTIALGLPLFLLARRPTLRRLAVRNASRRPRETLLVLLGSMLGTAIITSSFVVGDTLDSSIRSQAFTKLGPIDVMVRSNRGEPGELAALFKGLPGDVQDGVLAAVSVEAAVHTAGDSPLAEPNTNVIETDFAAAREFGNAPEATGIDGPTPAPGTAAVGTDLAKVLALAVGDDVVLNAYGTSVVLKVDRILPRLGIAGLAGGGSEAYTMFVAPGTIAGLRGTAPVGGAPPINLALLSAPGGVLEGAKGSPALEKAAEAALGDQPAQVVPLKAQVLEAAEEEGAEFTELFGAIGFFSVLAGVLLLVNIFVMLAQERKTELGMLRAVGLRRAGLIGAFHLEGWMYAVVSSLVGVAFGIGLGRVIVAVATGIFSRPGEDFSLELHFDATLRGVLQGFQLGFLISVFTVFITAVWVARLNVIRAIRDLPEPEGHSAGLRRYVLGAAALVVGGAFTYAGIEGESPLAALAGPALLGAAAVQLLMGIAPRRVLVSVVSLGVIVWEVLAFQLLPDVFNDAPIPTFVVQGVCLTAAAVALVSQNQDVIGSGLHRLGGGRSMSLRLGLAYPLARRFRTGMTLAMYALVMFTLTFITVFSHLFSAQIDTFTKQISGGFDLVSESNPAQPALPDQVRQVEGVEAVSVLSRLGAEWKIDANPDFEPWAVGTFDEVFLDRGAIELEKRDKAYADDEAAYRAVLADPNLVILPTFFLAGGGGPPPAVPVVGSRVTLRDPLSGTTRDLVVAAHAKSGFANDLPLISPVALAEIFGPRVTPNLLRIVTAEDADPSEVARRINAQFLASGADARSFRDIAAENVAQQQSFLRLMQGYLALGLVVGVAGLGVVMVRAVRERRRQIGVLRSLGFPSSAVRAAFVTESSFVAAEGIIVGVVLGMVVAWRLVTQGVFGGRLEFSVPIWQMALLVLGTFFASVLATATPAQQASRIRPAVALRMTD